MTETAKASNNPIGDELKGKPGLRDVAAEKGEPIPQPAAVVNLTEKPIDTISDWGVDQLRSALSAHEDGDFEQTSKLVEAMGRDPRFEGCLTALTAACMSLPFRLEVNPNAENQAKAKEARDLAAKHWEQMISKGALRWIIEQHATLGSSLAQLLWFNRPEYGLWIPSVEPWHMNPVRYQREERRFYVQAKEGRFLIRPGDGQWMFGSPNGPRSWVRGAVRCLAPLYAYRNYSYRDWMRWSEKHGLPILAIMEPGRGKDTERDAFYKTVARIGRDGTARLPQGDSAAQSYDLKYISVTGSPDTFRQFLQDSDVSIAIILLGQNLTTEVQGGSLAAANVADRVRADILQATVDYLGELSREQMLTPFGRYNMPGWEDDWAPIPKWDTARPEDPQAKATIFSTVSVAVQPLVQAGIISKNEARAQLGLPPVDGMDELTEPQGPPQLDGEGKPIPQETKPARLAPPPPAQKGPQGQGSKGAPATAAAEEPAPPEPSRAKGEKLNVLVENMLGADVFAAVNNLRAFKAPSMLFPGEFVKVEHDVTSGMGAHSCVRCDDKGKPTVEPTYHQRYYDAVLEAVVMHGAKLGEADFARE